MVGISIRGTQRSNSFTANVRQGEDFKPSAAQIISAGFGSGNDASGSFVEDVDAGYVNREMNRETTFMQDLASSVVPDFVDGYEPTEPLNKEGYESSEYFREEIPYEEGLTQGAARVRARRYDLDQERAFILNNAGLAGKGAFFTSALAGSIVDAKNLAAGVAASSVLNVGGIGVAAVRGAAIGLRSAKGLRAVKTSTTEAVKAQRRARLAAGATVPLVAAESTLATLPSVVSGIQNAPATKTGYEVGDAFLDMAASVVISIGLHGAVRGGSQFYNRTATMRDKQAATQMIQSQLASAERVDATPLMNAQVAQADVPFTSVNPLVDRPRVTSSNGTFTARFADEGGLMANVKGRGATIEEATANLRRLYTDGLQEAADQTGVPPARLAQVKLANDLQTQLEQFDVAAREMEIAREAGLDLTRIADAENKVDEAALTAKKAEAELTRKPRSAAVQSKEANARERLRRAEEELSTVRSEVLGNIPSRVRAEQAALNQQAAEAFENLRRVQGEEAARGFEQFATEQLDPAAARSRSSDDVVRSIDEDLITTDARRAPPPGEQGDPPAGAERELLDLIESENVPESTRSLLREEYELEVTLRNKRARALAALKACRGAS